MIGKLPKELYIDGVCYPINSDFRAVLAIFQAFNDESFSEHNKVMTMLEILYDFNIPPNINEAQTQAVWFLDCGMKRNVDAHKTKLMDWEKDEQLVFAAVNEVAKREVRADDYCHWWTFAGYYMSISEDSVFSAVAGVRSKLAKGIKLLEHERKFYNENRDLIDFDSGNIGDVVNALRGE